MHQVFRKYVQTGDIIINKKNQVIKLKKKIKFRGPVEFTASQKYVQSLNTGISSFYWNS